MMRMRTIVYSPSAKFSTMHVNLAILLSIQSPSSPFLEHLVERVIFISDKRPDIGLVLALRLLL